MADRVASGFYKAVPIKVTLDDKSEVYVQLGRSKRKKTQQALVMLEITSPGPAQGQHLPWFGFFSKESAQRTIDSFRMMGWDGGDLDSILTTDLNQEVYVQVDNHEFEGKRQSRISWINDSENAPPIKLDNALSSKEKESLGKSLAKYFDASST